MTITEFILARVAEDEEAAKAAYPSPWCAGGNPGGHVWTGNDSGDPEEGPTVYVNGGIYANQRRTAEHIARAADPARVLADCRAKRRLVTRHRLRKFYHPGPNSPSLTCSACSHVPWPCIDLRDFASAWADHPDYREEWR